MTVSRGEPLSRRELEVLRLTADGLSDAEIGEELDLSIDTVKTHLKRLRAKLGAKNRAHAVALGFDRRLLTRAAQR